LKVDQHSKATITARHEAAHVVIGTLLGSSVDKVSILPERGTSGRCCLTFARTASFEERCAVLLAGVVNEERGPITIWTNPALDGDWPSLQEETIRFTAGKSASPKSHEGFYRGLDLARRLVRKHAAAIDHVAAVLDREKVISGAEVARVVSLALALEDDQEEEIGRLRAAAARARLGEAPRVRARPRESIFPSEASDPLFGSSWARHCRRGFITQGPAVYCGA
jgi:hypothetical protein